MEEEASGIVEVKPDVIFRVRIANFSSQTRVQHKNQRIAWGLPTLADPGPDSEIMVVPQEGDDFNAIIFEGGENNPIERDQKPDPESHAVGPQAETPAEGMKLTVNDF